MNKIDSKFKDKYIHIICYDGVELNGMCENIDEHKKELQILGIKYKYNEIKQIEEYFNPIERQLLLFISKKELQFLKDRKFDITKNLTSISKQLGDYINIHDDLTNDIVICKNILIKLENMDTTGKKLYTYVSVVYDDDMIGKIINNSYYYKTDIENISIGDKVLVDRQGTETEAEVINVEYVNEDNLPFPLERTKNIIKVIGDSESSNNNFKHDDSELSDNNNFKLDDSNYYERSLLIIKDNDNFKENNCNFDSVIILPKNHNNLKSYIKNACVIITVGDVKLYNLDTKFIININNTNNKGCFTCNLTITNNDDYNSVINSIYRSIYIGGLITIDLFDIASALNGNFSFKSIEFEKSKEINNFYSLTNQKIFICICFNFCENVDYEELEKIMDKIRNKFLDADIIQYSFPVLDKKEDSKLMINLFCEEKICPNCGGKLVDILYGMPSVKSLEEADQQKIYIGGCEYSDDNPVYHCFKCNRDYYEDLVTYLTTKDSEIDSALFKELEFRNKTLSPIQ